MIDWICTKCMWKGNYKETVPVMYRGVDWQQCPSCMTVAIPITEKFPFEQVVEAGAEKVCIHKGCLFRGHKDICHEDCEHYRTA